MFLTGIVIWYVSSRGRSRLGESCEGSQSPPRAVVVVVVVVVVGMMMMMMMMIH
jgi:hypothetical protein